MEQNVEHPLVSIIILNYNAGKLLEDCINSIFQSNYKNYEIIVVDNDSKDQSHVQCKEKFPLINLIENRKITQGHGKILVGLENASIIAKKIIDKKLSVRQAENLVRLYKSPKKLKLVS